jgi:hypothetical protein
MSAELSPRVLFLLIAPAIRNSSFCLPRPPTVRQARPRIFRRCTMGGVSGSDLSIILRGNGSNGSERAFEMKRGFFLPLTGVCVITVCCVSRAGGGLYPLDL